MGGGANSVRALERLLPIACATSAVLLFASEFMKTFVVTEPVQGALCELAASDRHLYAFAVLAAFALVALVVALANGSKPAATAVGACGVIALGLFLAIDLPDATASGTLGEGCSPVEGSFAEASIDPQLGFWVALFGALGLATTGVALATFTPEQIGLLAPGWLRRRFPLADDPGPRRRRSSRTEGASVPFDAEAGEEPDEDDERPRSRRRRPRPGPQE